MMMSDMVRMAVVCCFCPMSPPHGAGECLGGGFVNGCVSGCLSYREAEC